MKKIILVLPIVFLSFGAVTKIAAQGKKSKSAAGQTEKAGKNKARPSIARNGVPAEIENKNEKAPTASADSNGIETPPFPADEKVGLPKPATEKLSDETLGGNMIVDVSANGNTVIKIGLADRAVALIDFPADDPVYKIHPGNENFVTVGCIGREESGKCLNSPTDAIVLRPGKDFHALGSEESAATVITIQRISGIVVTLIVVPVRHISENTNYVAVRYDLAEVLKTRRNSGLPVNLFPSGGRPGVTTNVQSSGAGNAPPVSDAALIAESSGKTDSGKTAEQSAADEPESLEKLLVDELQRSAKGNSAIKFSKPVYGLSLARTGGFSSPGKDITVEVVAVRNTLPESIRLVPDQPTVVVENKDSRQTSINVDSVNLLYTATTVEDSEVLEPGRIYYFAFAYRSPILGVKQSLRVNFAQRAAADAPASLTLSGAAIR